MVNSLLHDSPISVADSLAAGLLQIRAVEIRPNDRFTWSSGWKSPIYCDNRQVLGFPVLRELVIRGFQSIVETHFPGADLIAGAATGGIAHAAMLADWLGLPMAYVRSKAKDHGKQKRVEGKVRAQNRAILIEDTLSTGKSAYDAVEALHEEGVEVLAVCSIFSYDFDLLKEKITSYGVPAYRLLNYQTLIEVAQHIGYVSPDDVQTLLEWRAAPDR